MPAEVSGLVAPFGQWNSIQPLPECGFHGGDLEAIAVVEAALEEGVVLESLAEERGLLGRRFRATISDGVR
jgi:hypothetical protein